MIKVEGNLKIDTYNDNSGAVLNFSPEGTVVEQTIVNTSEEQPNAAQAENRIYLNTRSRSKIDLFRVIMALQKTGFFVDKTGAQATQKDVFNAFGSMLDENFSSFQKNISEAAKHNDCSEVSTAIFDELSAAFAEYESVIRNK